MPAKTGIHNIRFWCNWASQIKEGQEQSFLRNEDSDHHANRIPVPESVPLYVGENHDVPKDNYDRFVAYIEMPVGFAVKIGRKTYKVGSDGRTCIACGQTRKAVHDKLAFDRTYSRYAPSCNYRSFRELFGFTENIQTPEQKSESAERGLNALAALCMGGGSNAKA